MSSLLRKLRIEDAEGMLEWMHDSDTNQYFRFEADKMTKEKAEKFIKESMSEHNMNYAVADQNDVYLGTISLKNINYHDGNAEYAISLRKCARGTGAAKCATLELLQFAFHTLKLQKVYLNVLSENLRAIRFYQKIGFRYVGESKNHVKIRGVFHDLMWFEIQKEDVKSGNDTV